MGTHLSARAVRVFACLAVAIWKMYDFRRPGVSALRVEFSFRVWSSSGMVYSDGFLSSTLFPASLR
jgi:hypothetical protein